MTRKIEKGEKVQITIEDVTHEGTGIGKAEGFPLFVGETVVGDQVLVEVTKVKKNYGFGKVCELLVASPHRVEPSCSLMGCCGGCSYGETAYEQQLFIKEKQVKESIRRLGGVSQPQVCPMVTMDHPYEYRNKATFAISTGGNRKIKGGIIENLGPVAVGFHKKNSHKVLPVYQCMLQHPVALEVARVVRQFMVEDHLTAWDEKWQQGLMKSLVVKTAFATGEVMVILEINGKGIPHGEKLLAMMDQAVYEQGYFLESVFLDTGKEPLRWAGKGVIKEKLGSLHFEISPGSFYQTNPYITEKLYDKVVEYAQLTGRENVLDLYCGVGSIGLWCASKAAYVLGIESVKAAVLDANRNAVINGIVNARYLCGKAEEEIPKLLDGEGEEELVAMAGNAQVVIVDPPRAGCRRELIEAIGKIGPDRLVYVSCDPGTLARDIKAFGEQGYAFEEATPFDMFPWTRHVETCVLLVKRSTSEA